MKLIQKYNLYKDLKKYLDEHYKEVCFFPASNYSLDVHVCDRYSLEKTNGEDMRPLYISSTHVKNHPYHPIKYSKYVLHIANNKGALPNAPQDIPMEDGLFAKLIFKLMRDAHKKHIMSQMRLRYHGMLN